MNICAGLLLLKFSHLLLNFCHFFNHNRYFLPCSHDCCLLTPTQPCISTQGQ